MGRRIWLPMICLASLACHGRGFAEANPPLEQFRIIQAALEKEARAEEVSSTPAALLDAYESQPYGDYAKVGLCYRNTKEIRFTARRLQALKLPDHLRTQDFPTVLESLLEPPEKAIQWRLPLKSDSEKREHRIEVITPLRDPGIYRLEGRLAEGAVTQCLVEISSMMLLAKPPLDFEAGFGYVFDARTGQPVPEAMVRWTGSKPLFKDIYNRRDFTMVPTHLPLTMGENGSFPLELRRALGSQSMLEAWTADGRIAALGGRSAETLFRDVRHRQEERADVFLVLDRNFYRPGDQVHLALWHRSPRGSGRSRAPQQAGQVKVCLRNPSGETFSTAITTMDDRGMAVATLDIPDTTVAGKYSVSTDEGRGYTHLMVAPAPAAETGARILISAPLRSEKKRPSFPVSFKLADRDQVAIQGAVIEVQVEMLPTMVQPDAGSWEWLYGRDYLQKRVQQYSDIQRPVTKDDHGYIVARRQLRTDESGRAGFEFELPICYLDQAEGGQRQYVVTACGVVQGTEIAAATAVVQGAPPPPPSTAASEGIRVAMDQAHYRPGDTVELDIQASPGGPFLLYERIEQGRYAPPVRVEVDAEGHASHKIKIVPNDSPEKLVEIVGVRRARCLTTLVRIPVPPSHEWARVELGLVRGAGGERSITLQALREDGRPVASAQVVMSACLKDLEPYSFSTDRDDIRKFFVSKLSPMHQPLTPCSAGELRVDLRGERSDLGLMRLQTKRKSRMNPSISRAAEPWRISEELVQRLLAQTIPWPNAGKEAGQFLWETSLTTSADGRLEVPLHLPVDLPDDKVRVRAWVRGSSGEYGQAELK